MLEAVVIVLFVMMALCAVVGAIYAYLYFTRINPACKVHRGICSAVGTSGGGIGVDGVRQASVTVDDDHAPGRSTTTARQDRAPRTCFSFAKRDDASVVKQYKQHTAGGRKTSANITMSVFDNRRAK